MARSAAETKLASSPCVFVSGAALGPRTLLGRGFGLVWSAGLVLTIRSSHAILSTDCSVAIKQKPNKGGRPGGRTGTWQARRAPSPFTLSLRSRSLIPKPAVTGYGSRQEIRAVLL